MKKLLFVILLLSSCSENEMTKFGARVERAMVLTRCNDDGARRIQCAELDSIIDHE
jgi:hypothetical protein